MVGCGLNTCPSVLQKYGQKKTMYSFGILWVSRLSCLVYSGPVRPPRSSSFVASTPGLQIPSQKVLRRNPPKRVHCYRSRGDLWSGKAWRCSPRRKGNNAHVHRNTRRLPVQRLWPSPKGLQHGGSVEFIICQPLLFTKLPQDSRQATAEYAFCKVPAELGKCCQKSSSAWDFLSCTAPVCFGAIHRLVVD